IKPNKKELTERTGKDDPQAAAQLLIQQCGVFHVLASRSEEGVCLISEKECHAYPATARQVGEVSGAGDTLIAVTAAACAAGAAGRDAAWLGNLAAGIAVEKDKTSTLTMDELLAAIGRHHPE